jgi:hypothetical protein
MTTELAWQKILKGILSTDEEIRFMRKTQERINPINEVDSQTRNREKVNIRKNKKYNYYICFSMNTECSWSQFPNPKTSWTEKATSHNLMLTRNTSHQWGQILAWSESLKRFSKQMNPKSKKCNYNHIYLSRF